MICNVLLLYCWIALPTIPGIGAWLPWAKLPSANVATPSNHKEEQAFPSGGCSIRSNLRLLNHDQHELGPCSKHVHVNAPQGN